MVNRGVFATILSAVLLTALAVSPLLADGVVKKARVLAPDHVKIELTQPVDDMSPGNFRFAQLSAPDVPIRILDVQVDEDNKVLLTVGQRLDPAGGYQVQVLSPPGTFDVKPTAWALLFSVIISAALINNFVFTRYLGLCVFFGVSKKRETAIGMGFTFWMVMAGSGVISWILYAFVLEPLKLAFLQILVFIGIVAFMVQFFDTMLKKTHPALHRKFGIYLMLITTNCVIIAVPLLNASPSVTAVEAFALSVGAGGGFALALFLMSCARERLELARVPESYKGLPIAFALAGLFALAFMGFSGLTFMR
jgi:electron transport complex protein RnfA